MKSPGALLIATTAGIALLAASSAAAEELIDSEASFSSFTHNYYLAPQPDLIESAMRFVATSALVENPKTAPLLEMSFSCLVHRADLHGRSWQHVVDSLEEPGRSVLSSALSNSPATLFQRAPLSPSQNDLAWACFFATGDVRHVEGIVSTLQHFENREDLNLFLTAASAKWSLASNARSHAAVKDLLETFAKGKGVVSRHAGEALSMSPSAVRGETVEILKLQHELGMW